MTIFDHFLTISEKFCKIHVYTLQNIPIFTDFSVKNTQPYSPHIPVWHIRECLPSPLFFSAEPDIRSVSTVLEFIKKNLRVNYAPSVVMLGAAAMAMHYHLMAEKFQNISIPMAIGEPCSGKSTSTNLALATLGISDSIHGKYIARHFVS